MILISPTATQTLCQNYVWHLRAFNFQVNGARLSQKVWQHIGSLYRLLRRRRCHRRARELNLQKIELGDLGKAFQGQGNCGNDLAGVPFARCR
jgi:hypothetical protein